MSTPTAYRAPVSAPAAVRSPGVAAYSPWEHLGALDGVTLTHHDDGPAGLTSFSTATVSLRSGMSAAERRCTLAHELAHIERGPVAGRAGSVARRADEHMADLTAALRLVPAFVLDDLPALVEAHGREAACAFLGLDRGMLRAALAICRAVAS